MSLLMDNIAFLVGRPGEQQGGMDKLGLSATADELVKGAKVPTAEDLLLLSNHFGLSADLMLKRDLKQMLKAAEQEIKLLILDVDGVMTDGGMFVTDAGDEFKRFNVKDGVAIRRLTKKGFQVGIISSGYLVNLIMQRADLLGIQRVHVGQEPKLDTLKAWSDELNIPFQNTAFIGDDLNDKAVMEAVGLAVCPSDACDEIKGIADLIMTRKGGMGCIREFLDHYLTNNPMVGA